MRRPAVLLSLALVLSAAAACAQADPSIPFRFEDLRLYVPATVGSRAGEFVLDTGASNVMIDATTAAAVGLGAKDEHSTRGAGRGSLRIGDTGAVSLSVGGVPLKVASADVAPINGVLRTFDGNDIGGIIGKPLFEAHVVEIDFARHTLVLHDPKTFAYRGPGVRLPFRFLDGDPVVRGALVLSDGTRLPLRLLIDLGAKADLLIAEPFIRAHHLTARAGPTVTEPLGAGVGGETRYAFARLAGLDVGGALHAHGLIAGLSVGGTLRGGGWDALLGAGVLQRYRVIVDYPRREMIFAPRTPAPAERFDRSGAFLVAEGPALELLVVHDVVAGSPADQAGVRRGDVIETVDGRAARDLKLWDVRAALSAPGDVVVKLGLLRGGRRISETVRLKDLI